MTDSLGRRLARYRKRVGIRSTRELAERTGGQVSESVLQNIESGRRQDMSVSQLLEVARALRISPVLLLAPMETPLEPVDLDGLGPAFEGMRGFEFDAWFSSTGDRTVEDMWLESGSVGAVELHATLRLMRALVPDLDTWQSNAEDLARIDDSEQPPGLGRDDLLLERKQVQERIDARVAQLEALGVDTAWVPRPWREEA